MRAPSSLLRRGWGSLATFRAARADFLQGLVRVAGARDEPLATSERFRARRAVSYAFHARPNAAALQILGADTVKKDVKEALGRNKGDFVAGGARCMACLLTRFTSSLLTTH